MPSKITVVGSAIMDLVFTASRMPEAGETLIGDSFAAYPGGKGANQAVAIAKLGGDVQFVGVLGDDANGASLRKSLEAAGVDCSHLRVHPSAPSGTAGILIDGQGENRIIIAPGANKEMEVAQVEAALTSQTGPVLAQLEIPMTCVEAAAKASGPFFLNPAPVLQGCDLDVLLARVEVVTPNEIEAEHLTGERPSDSESCRRVAGLLLDRGVQHVVLTLGERGCYWRSASEEAHVGARPVRAVDTVGAGDAFSGALTFFLNEGREWRNALELANCAAAISVTKHGAQSSMPTLVEVRELAGPTY